MTALATVTVLGAMAAVVRLTEVTVGFKGRCPACGLYHCICR